MEALQGGRVKRSGNMMCPEVCPSTWQGSSTHVPRVLRAQWMLQLWQGIEGTLSPTHIQPLAPSNLDTPFE